MFLSKNSLNISILLILFCSNLALADDSSGTYYDLSEESRYSFIEHDYKNSLKFLNLAIQKAPLEAEAYLNRGALYEVLNDHTNAIKDEDTAINLAHGNTDDDLIIRSAAHENLARVYLNIKQLTKAQLEAETAIQTYPKSASAYESLGNVFVKLDKKLEAIKAYQNAKELYLRRSVFEDLSNNKTIKELDHKIDELQTNAYNTK